MQLPIQKEDVENQPRFGITIAIFVPSITILEMTDKIKPLTRKELAAEVEQLRKMYHLDPSVKPDMKKTREILSKVDLSSSLILERRGGDMWEDLKKWLTEQRRDPPYGDDYYTGALFDFEDKMKEIEREYGIQRNKK